MTYIKSPLNYIGGKYKILKDILPLFPDNIDTFYDIFAGGLNVAINVDAKKYYCNDQITYLIDLYKYFSENKYSDVKNEILKLIKKYNLNSTNIEGYLKLRESYNKNKSSIKLFLLTCYSFNHQIRFNSKHEFNVPFGINRSSFNDSIDENLKLFINKLNSNKFIFDNKDFRDININKIKKHDFVYCDPPYLITTGTYNDGKRGFNGWYDSDDKDLLNYLDKLNDNGIKFALSNVLVHKGLKNDELIGWCKKYNINYIDKNYDNCNYHSKNKENETIEVLITNYEK